MQYPFSIKSQIVAYSSQQAAAENAAKKPRKKRRKLLVAATSGIVILGIINYSDDARVVFNAIQRTGRVLTTLTLCVNE